MFSPQTIKWRDPHLAMKEHFHLSIGNLIGFSLFIAGITRQVLGSSLKAPDHQMLQRKSQSLSKTRQNRPPIRYFLSRPAQCQYPPIAAL